MTITAQSTPALYPPTVTPPQDLLPLRKFLFQVIRNPLAALPQSAYRERFLVRNARGGQIFWIIAPDLVEDVLIKKAPFFQKSPVEKRVFRRALRDGVLSSDGALWRWQRRTMAPLFRPADMLNYVPSMVRPAEELLERWRLDGSFSVQNVDADMTEATFAVIVRTMLCGVEPAEVEVIRQATTATLKHITWDVVYGLLNLPVWMPHPASWQLNRMARRLRGAVHDIIVRRQHEGSGGDDLLGRLLDARDPDSGEPMDMERLINNLLTLLEAGHETTARGLTWTLYLLARSPEWQDRLREEVTMVCGNDSVQADHIARLQVTQQVLKESMRLYPPVPVVSRHAADTVDLGDAIVPKGSMIIVPIYCIHRHEKLWDDPRRFDPDRFTPEREAVIPRTQFMPFGAGARICLGNSFAMTEAIAILATLIRGARFDWDGKTLPEPISRVTLQTPDGMPLKVTLLQS